MKLKYDIIYSIGMDCACAIYLNKFNLRICSGPFDWINVVPFEKRIELILNDFKNFFNKEDIILLTKSEDKTQNFQTDDYTNKHWGFNYYHDFPAGISFEESYPIVKEKYDRRIKRFLENLKSDKKVLLVWFSHCPTATDNNQVVFLCNQVCEKFNKQIDFLIIEHDESKKDNEIYKFQLAKNIIKYNLYTHSWNEDGTPTTTGREEICSTLFKNYEIKKSFLFFIKDIFFTQLFSVQNEYSNDIKHKVIRILGIKLKIKVKNKKLK